MVTDFMKYDITFGAYSGKNMPFLCVAWLVEGWDSTCRTVHCTDKAYLGTMTQLSRK